MYRTVALAWGTFLIASLLVPDAGRAQGFQMLYAFQGGSDGSYPVARLLEDSAGNLYGTTMHGGGTTCDQPYGCGTVFALAPDGTESVLYAFSRKPRGLYPNSDLVMDKKGNLYGTTDQGGDGRCGGARGCGAVFKLTPGGKEKVLYSFQGGSDGRFPSSGLLADGTGSWYGTTPSGGGTVCKFFGRGAGGCGTVFKLGSDGTKTVLYRFQGGSDGQAPAGDLTRDAAGNFYGTTEFGGGSKCPGKAGCGTVFKLTPNGTETVIHAFGGVNGGDGAFPLGGVTLDSSGNLYGTTWQGGNACSNGCGTVFRLTTDGTESLLYSFCSQVNCTDGAIPTAGVIVDQAGNLYGTTSQGGSSSCSSGCGAVFELSPNGTETLLHAFDSRDGADPEGGLIMDQSGNLYGTTLAGGPNQAGAVFAITK